MIEMIWAAVSGVHLRHLIQGTSAPNLESPKIGLSVMLFNGHVIA
jgi:hypothetical protein